MAFSPDSKSLVAGGQDVSILHWDISTGKEIGRFRQRGGWPAGLTFSDDGKKLAVAAEAIIRIWDVVKQKELNLDSEPYDRIWSVALSEDDKTLAASDYNSFRFWDPDCGKEVGRSSSSFVGAYSLAFLQGGRTLVSTAYDQELRAWNVPSGKELFQSLLRKHNQLVLHDRDQSHPTLAGSYLAACVFFAVLVKESPVGIDDGVPGLDEKHRILLQKTAWQATKSIGSERSK